MVGYFPLSWGAVPVTKKLAKKKVQQYPYRITRHNIYQVRMYMYI